MSNHDGYRRFEGRVAIVTGSSREPSISRSTAARLAAEGASVVVNARTEGPLRDAEAALRPAGLEVVAVPGAAEDERTHVDGGNHLAGGGWSPTADGLRPAGTRS